MRQFRNLILFAVLVFGSCLSMAQPDSLLHTNFAKRYEYVFQLERDITGIPNMTEALDSLQRTIDRVNKAGDKAFAYQLRFIRIYIDKYMDQPNALKGFNEWIEEGSARGFEYEALEAKNKLAKYYWGNDNKTKAMELGLSAYKAYENLSPEDFPERYTSQRTLAGWYYSFKDYKRAKDLILELMQNQTFDTSKHHVPCMILLGLSYRELGELDSSLYFFKQAYFNTYRYETEGNRALAAGNIGSVYYIKKEYDDAIYWVNKELDIWRLENNNRTFASYSDYLALAEIYLKKKNISMAQVYLDSATWLQPSVRRSFINTHRFYSVTCGILEANGDLRGALIYKDSILIIRDSINRAKSTSQILAAEKRIAEAEHQSELVYLEAMRKSSLWIRNFVIIALLFLAVIAFLLINRSRLRLKQKELVAISEKNKAENKLLHFTLEFQAKNSQIDELKEELSLLSDEKDLSDKNEAILKLQQSTILTDAQWDEFRLLFEQVYSGFIAKLKQEFQGLTPAELRYLTLLKLQLSNKEMANILGVSMNTVHNYKSRMRKKYAIAEDIAFEDLIQEL